MIKVCLVAICYNAYKDALNYLQSINEAFVDQKNIELTIVLSDNSTTDERPNDILNNDWGFKLEYLKNNNIGYFPAFTAAVNKVEKDDFDYIIISNVDLKLGGSFFNELEAINFSDSVGVIAPAIVSLNDGRDLNPKILERPSKKKLLQLKNLFSIPYFFRFYVCIARLKEFIKAKKVVKNNFTPSEHIYAPHGSFIIFTKSYFSIEGSINYPRFLFGEEVFVAEEAINHKLKVIYENRLKVYDIEHGSTSLKNANFLAKHHVLSYKFLLNKYFSGY